MNSVVTVPLIPAIAVALTLLATWGKLAVELGRQTHVLQALEALLSKQDAVISDLRRSRHRANNQLQVLWLCVGMLADGHTDAVRQALATSEMQRRTGEPPRSSDH